MIKTVACPIFTRKRRSLIKTLSRAYIPVILGNFSNRSGLWSLHVYRFACIHIRAIWSAYYRCYYAFRWTYFARHFVSCTIISDSFGSQYWARRFSYSRHIACELKYRINCFCIGYNTFSLPFKQTMRKKKHYSRSSSVPNNFRTYFCNNIHL